MIVYFSGTGNSRYTAQFLKERLHEELLDAGAWIKEGRRAPLRSETPWIFVSPTYSWQIPHILKAWILAGDFRGCRDAYFLMTCGDSIGAASGKNRVLCDKKAFSYLGTAKIVMPENYIAMFSVPEEHEAEKIRRQAEVVLEEVAGIIRRREPLPEHAPSLGGHVLTSLVNPLFYRFVVRASPFYVAGNCVSCGACVRACPLNNIRLEGGIPRWGDQCTHCMACICCCPTEAVEYGKKSCGKPRYQCPPYHEGR